MYNFFYWVLARRASGLRTITIVVLLLQTCQRPYNIDSDNARPRNFHRLHVVSNVFSKFIVIVIMIT